MLPAIKYRDIWIGFTDLAFCRWQMPANKNQKETPYTEEGRALNFTKTKKKRANARLDEICTPRTVNTVLKGTWGKLNNFAFIMNRAYALNQVNNLASMHKQCFIAINHQKTDLSQFDEKARKKINYYRKKIGHSYNQQQTI